MENSEVKTIISCSTKDFFKLMNSVKVDVDNFFKKTKLNEIIYKSADIPDTTDEKEKEKALHKAYTKRFENVVNACFGDNIDLTYDLLTKLCFGDREYVENMGSIEVVNFVFNVFTNPKLLPFFTTYFPTD